MRRIFSMHSSEGKLSSASAIEALNDMDDAPWRGFREEKGIDSYRLGKMLAQYGIKTRTTRIGDTTVKGWAIDQFVADWERYLPTTTPSPGAVTSVTTVTTAIPTGDLP
jgi:hypothetical protein